MNVVAGHHENLERNLLAISKCGINLNHHLIAMSYHNLIVFDIVANDNENLLRESYKQIHDLC